MKNNEKHEIEDDSFVLVQRNNHIACFFFLTIQEHYTRVF